MRRAQNSQSLEKPPNSTIVTIEGRILRAILHKKHAFDIFFVATVTLLGSFENTLFVKHTIVYFYNSTCVSETEVLLLSDFFQQSLSSPNMTSHTTTAI